jgi:hypothetical protein
VHSDVYALHCTSLCSQSLAAGGPPLTLAKFESMYRDKIDARMTKSWGPLASWERKDGLLALMTKHIGAALKTKKTEQLSSAVDLLDVFTSKDFEKWMIDSYLKCQTSDAQCGLLSTAGAWF